MQRRDFLRVLPGAAAVNSAWGQRASRPNIIVMLADDMGFSDIGCYGGEIKTPNLDALAQRGIRFTQFYNNAKCCPTRASLLTGLFPPEAGVGDMTGDDGIPGYRGDLSKQSVTIAQVLKSAGYKTYMSGKWHVTQVDLNRMHNYPLQRGFDRYFGTITGAGSYYDPTTLMDGNKPIRAPSNGFYYTDAIADHAIEYITGHGKDPAPFFMYVAFTCPHWPLHALESDVAKYKGVYDQGWDSLREKRHKRMLEMGVVDAKWPLSERDPQAPAWKDAPDKAWHARRMEVYAAQIDRMDQNIGRILGKLRELGQEDNTLVLFLADNGGCHVELTPSRGGEGIPKATHDGRPVQVGNLPQHMPGPETTFQSYGTPWANASNTPFRLFKSFVHEGGISTPLIARWPARIKKGGGYCRDMGHLVDIMATCVDVAGAKYPETFQGEKITPLEGKTLTPLLDGGKRAGHAKFYWEHEGSRAYREGKWKAVTVKGSEWELYDIEADRSELNNLAAKNPEKLRDMVKGSETFATSKGWVPYEKVQAQRKKRKSGA